MKNQSDNLLSVQAKLSALGLEVDDLMTRNPVAVMITDTIGFLEAVMNKHHIRHVPIQTQNGHIVGVVSQRDLLSALPSDLAVLENNEIKNFKETTPCGLIMTSNLETAERHTSLRTASIAMAQHKIGCLPIFEDEKLTGILTESDFLKFYANADQSMAPEAIGIR
jgi:CBS domain-containing protein